MGPHVSRHDILLGRLAGYAVTARKVKRGSGSPTEAYYRQIGLEQLGLRVSEGIGKRLKALGEELGLNMRAQLEALIEAEEKRRRSAG